MPLKASKIDDQAIARLINLANLARHPVPEARSIVAQGSAIRYCPEAVYLFSVDPDPDVRRSLAGNPILEHFPDIVAKLASDEDESVREAIAENHAAQRALHSSMNPTPESPCL